MKFNKTIFSIYLISFITVLVLFFKLFTRLAEIKTTLKEISEEANQITSASIKQDIPFNSFIDINQPMDVMKSFNARILFNLNKQIMINDSILFNQELKIPIDILIDTLIDLDEFLVIKNDSTIIYAFKSPIYLEQDIMIDLPGLKKLKIPIKTTIPLDQEIKARLNDSFLVQGKVPVKIRIKKVITYTPHVYVPIKNLLVDVNFPINEIVTIHLKEPLQIKTRLPINQKVPVDIKIQETGLYKPIKTISYKLNRLGGLIFPF